MQKLLRAGELSLRRMADAPADYAHLAAWLADPRIAEWYAGVDGSVTVEAVWAKYGPRVRGESPVVPCIVEMGGTPVGYVQYYPAGEDSGYADAGNAAAFSHPYAVDLFVDPAHGGRGVGSRVLGALCHYLAEQAGADIVLLDPRADNARAIRCYTKAGFRPLGLLSRREERGGRIYDSLLLGWRPGAAKEALLVSACLLGVPCRYDGRAKPCAMVQALAGEFALVPVCPEQLGGLSTPRPPAERREDGVYTAAGADVTAAYRRGAAAAVAMAQKHGCRAAILKEKSPACGVRCVYDGAFSGTLRAGEGVAAGALRRAGVAVYSEEEALYFCTRDMIEYCTREHIFGTSKGDNMNPIFHRRSIRKFLNKPVEREKLERIARAGQLAPSAMARFPWEILIATSPEAKQMVQTMSPYSKMAAEAGAIIVVCGNMQVAEGDWWVQDCAACTENILLQIVAEGLGGVWIGTYPKEDCMRHVADFFQLPAHIVPFATIALGYSEVENVAKDRFDPAKVHYEQF